MLSRQSPSMGVSLPQSWEEFLAGQASSGEFGNASEVVREALAVIAGTAEARAVEEMRAAFAHVDPHGGQGEPNRADRALIIPLMLAAQMQERRLLLTMAAVKAALGQEGVAGGWDYRGVPVMASWRANPDSPWSRVAHMDTAEVYAPLRERNWMTIPDGRVVPEQHGGKT